MNDKGFLSLLRNDGKLKTYMVIAIICILGNFMFAMIIPGINEKLRMFLMMAFSMMAIDSASRFTHRYVLLQKEQEN